MEETDSGEWSELEVSFLCVSAGGPGAEADWAEITWGHKEPWGLLRPRP